MSVRNTVVVLAQFGTLMLLFCTVGVVVYNLGEYGRFTPSLHQIDGDSRLGIIWKNGAAAAVLTWWLRYLALQPK